MNALTSPIRAAPPATEASEPVRICFPFSGDAVGGSHVSVLGLVGQLDPAHYRALIVPELADGNIARLFAGHEMLPDPVARPRRFVPGHALGLAKFVGTLAGVPERMRFLRRHRIAIVHLNDGRTSANWALAARLASARIVWHHRGDPGALGLRIAAPLLADRVLTVSSFALPRKGLWSAARKAQVVHSPFDTDIAVDRDAARATLVRELGVSPDTVILGYFGAFVPRKRPLLFADMMARLRTLTGRPVIGLMFGEARVPEMAAALDRRIAENNAADIVRLMGYRTPGAFWIAACDQLVVPSIGEPFGRTLIEAMVVGTPVIATASGGNIEALDGGYGVLVAADDADALAQGCADLIADPASAARLAARARGAARARFSARRHHDQVTAVYAELLRG
ncbi:Glycosyl transferase [Sphingomonas sp. EC-HK361]|uniref:glycosyltransferase n=1 Tax=Sphingomonas sp. EC-HK361 TaxID=2038397 RepID=UPI00125A8AF4|nr:glycosyltransferase [Sphingomonas sp. EC-HK361]VVT22664.1 Glycosyl transferase [Sphingomonas sp. EC-HK361]